MAKANSKKEIETPVVTLLETDNRKGSINNPISANGLKDLLDDGRDYKIIDASIWFDYLALLEYFNKDLHNAKYVCPKNLKKEHDRLVEKKRERQRNEELERNRKNIEEAEILFKHKIKKFIGLQFIQGNIIVKVLESVKEFEQEGDILKHCVFSNEYYTKKIHLSFLLGLIIHQLKQSKLIFPNSRLSNQEV